MRRVKYNVPGIERRDPFIGRRIDSAADDLTGAAMAAALSKAMERSIDNAEQPLEEVRARFAAMAVLYEWFDRVGIAVDIRALRCEYPDVGWTSFDWWASAQNWTRILNEETKP